MHLESSGGKEEMTFAMYQGMHSSKNSTASSDWILGKCFKLVHVGDEMPVASRASRRHIQAAEH